MWLPPCLAHNSAPWTALRVMQDQGHGILSSSFQAVSQNRYFPSATTIYLLLLPFCCHILPPSDPPPNTKEFPLLWLQWTPTTLSHPHCLMGGKDMKMQTPHSWCWGYSRTDKGCKCWAEIEWGFHRNHVIRVAKFSSADALFQVQVCKLPFVFGLEL